MSIRGRHLRNMEKGVKRHELRKTRPGIDLPCRVALCQTGSGGMVAAVFECPAILNAKYLSEGKLAKLAAITAEEARGYRAQGSGELWAWKAERFRDIRGRGLHVTDFGLARAPMSWAYAKAEPEGWEEAAGDDEA